MPIAHSGTLAKVYQHSWHRGSFRAARPRNSLFAPPGTPSAFPAAGLALSADKVSLKKNAPERKPGIRIR